MLVLLGENQTKKQANSHLFLALKNVSYYDSITIGSPKKMLSIDNSTMGSVRKMHSNIFGEVRMDMLRAELQREQADRVTRNVRA